MDSARNAIREFTSKSGHHTIVDQTVNPAVTQEVIKPTKHEEITTAVDREVHQHHYHTTVQPIKAQEVLPERHQHNILPVEQREFRHDNEADTTQRVSAELGAFKDRQVVHDVRVTQSAAPTVTGEHVHHHVHETVVPIINKETIRPEVVHTTVPIHETHIAAAQHHGLSALPMKTLEEFTAAGGILQGGKHSTHEEYEGAPRPYNDKLLTSIEKLGLGSGTTGGVGTSSHRNTDSGVGGLDQGYGSNTTGTSHAHRNKLENELDPRVDAQGMDKTSSRGHHSGGTGNRLENELDPRVDSTGTGRHHGSSGLGGNSGIGGNNNYDDYDNSSSGMGRGNTGSAIDPNQVGRMGTTDDYDDTTGSSGHKSGGILGRLTGHGR